ncbi:aldo/keto reductase [Clostridiales bacterium TF09-2AC]|nr:aldo/keto reductase [Clostridiales bacterium TF09-2AC]
MRRMKVGNTGMEASVISMGTLSIGGDGVWGANDDTVSIRTIHRALELGIDWFDSSNFYGFGHAEEVLGQALQGRRDKCFISTKCGLEWDTGEGSPFFTRDGHQIYRNLSPMAVRRSLEGSLRRLKTDYIDLYITHWQSVPPEFTPIEETMGTLMDLKKEGKIRAIGASNVTAEDIREYLKYGQLDLIQERYSMLDPTSYDRLNGLCLEHNITYQAYSVLERGLLTGAYTMESKVTPGDARNEWSVWYQPRRRKRIIDLIEAWKPLCDKYGTTQAGLTIAWTLQQAPNINVDAGSRRVEAIEQNARGGGFLIEDGDLSMMNAMIKTVLDEEGIVGGNPAGK